MKAVLTDIEGTTSSIAFVKETLFPYARAHLPEFLRRHSADPEVAAWLHETRALAGRSAAEPTAEVAELAAVLVGWIDQDRKVAPLKSLQGLVWAEGYRAGALRGHVYPDAAAALRRWYSNGVTLAVFSSGSVEAQKLLFEFSIEGNLAPLFSAHFDTRTGSKQEAQSYRTIADQLRTAPADILFLSDVLAELKAARSAGLQVIHVVREGTHAVESLGESLGEFPEVATFEQLA